MAATMRAAVVAMFVMATFVAVCSAADLYLQLSDNDNVKVFDGVTTSNGNFIAGFGKGKVFDYPVTSKASASSSVVARAQGLYYRSSNQAKFEAFQEEFTVLFVENNAYSGNSFSFSGPWVTNAAHEFSITGGTGDLVGVQGTATLTYSGQGDAYKLTVKEFSAPRLESFLASRFLASHFLG